MIDGPILVVAFFCGAALALGIGAFFRSIDARDTARRTLSELEGRDRAFVALVDEVALIRQRAEVGFELLGDMDRQVNQLRYRLDRIEARGGERITMPGSEPTVVPHTLHQPPTPKDETFRTQRPRDP